MENFKILNKKNNVVKERLMKDLKEQVKYYRDAHNKLVEEIWEIDLKISHLKNEKDKLVLNERKNELLKEIEEKKYEKLINNLLEEIKSIEIELYGYSKIGSGSPDGIW